MTPYTQRREEGYYDAEPEPEPEEEPEEEPQDESGEWLIDLTKNELIDKAQGMGISPANASMSKADLIEAIEAGS